MNEAISSINPFSGEVNGEIELFTPKQVTHALENAAHAFGSWKSSSFLTRSEVLVNASKYLLANKDRLARLITLEMGKVSAEAVAEIEKCAWVCTYYAEKGEDFLKDDELPVKEANAKISYAPLGVVLAIMPWNFPFWQVFRFAAPAIMAGNCGLLKHAS
jgi:succinate-semialdehyde dehydrogenase/glutarate-semialdehyde dehydrogenase